MTYARVGLGGLLVLFLSIEAVAQQDGQRGLRRSGGESSVEADVARLMKLDANEDGQLTKDEVDDARLQPLLQRADANHDDKVTREELSAIFKKEAGSLSGRAMRPGGPARGVSARGQGPLRRRNGNNAQPEGNLGPADGPPGDGPQGDGPQGRGVGRGGPPRPGEILPPFLRDQLNLSDEQQAELEKLQKEVDARLSKILTPEQRQQLERMPRRPGRPPGNAGPPGGGPPEGGRPEDERR